MEKRGGNLSYKLIFLIIGVILLIVVIALVVNWYLKNTPDPISEQCQFACESNQKAAFCDVKRKVTKDLSTTCKELSEKAEYEKYKVESCPSISCILTPEELDKTCISGLGGTWETPDTNGNCVQGGNKIIREVTPSDNPPAEGQICCR